jgi:hypothetical protein
VRGQAPQALQRGRRGLQGLGLLPHRQSRRLVLLGPVHAVDLGVVRLELLPRVERLVVVLLFLVFFVLVLQLLVLLFGVLRLRPVERPSGDSPLRPSVAGCSRDSLRPGAGCAPYATS